MSVLSDEMELYIIIVRTTVYDQRRNFASGKVWVRPCPYMGTVFLSEEIGANRAPLTSCRAMTLFITVPYYRLNGF